jgi:hypothetical protein
MLSQLASVRNKDRVGVRSSNRAFDSDSEKFAAVVVGSALSLLL